MYMSTCIITISKVKKKEEKMYLGPRHNPGPMSWSKLEPLRLKSLLAHSRQEFKDPNLSADLDDAVDRIAVFDKQKDLHTSLVCWYTTE
jgi:hypothetical protein